MLIKLILSLIVWTQTSVWSPVWTEPTIQTPEETARVELTGRLLIGIIDYKRKHNPFHCGKKLEDGGLIDVSLEYAFQIVENYSGSPWGMAATIANESRFDACAIGKHARDWAIGEGILTKKKTTISHDQRSVLKAVRAGHAFGFAGIDLGPCQILTRFYPGEERLQTTISGGVRQCANHMEGGGPTPWGSWRGSYKKWYHDKIRRIARKLGATDTEMKEI